jgi:hypothetical protein
MTGPLDIGRATIVVGATSSMTVVRRQSYRYETP